jgi:hypothetical protein
MHRYATSLKEDDEYAVRLVYSSFIKRDLVA